MKSAPLYFIIAYIGLTFALILFGPVSYFGFNTGLTALFLGAVIFAISIGYHAGLSSFASLELAGERAHAPPFSVLLIFKICLLIAIASLVIAVAQGLAGGNLNLSAADIGQSYVDSYADYERNTGDYSAGFIIYSLSVTPTFIASIWGLLYFRRLSLFLKVSVVLLIVGTLLFYTVGSGKQKQLGDTIIFAIAVGAIAYARSGRAINLRIIMASLIAGLVAIVGFVVILSQRYAALSVDALNIIYKSNRLQTYDIEHPVFVIFGYDAGFALSVLTGYLSQGYFGLSLALESDMTWSYMIGFSYSLTVIFNRVFGLPWVIDQTYPYVVGAETSWDQSKWFSVFPHWASDFTFPGTVVLFGLFAFVYARVWREAVKYDNPFAVLLFSLITMGAFFIPANNQLFISPGSLLNVLIVVGLYLAFHKRFNCKLTKLS